MVIAGATNAADEIRFWKSHPELRPRCARGILSFVGPISGEQRGHLKDGVRLLVSPEPCFHLDSLVFCRESKTRCGSAVSNQHDSIRSLETKRKIGFLVQPNQYVSGWWRLPRVHGSIHAKILSCSQNFFGTLGRVKVLKIKFLDGDFHFFVVHAFSQSHKDTCDQERILWGQY